MKPKKLSEREKYLIKLSDKKLRLIKKFYNDRIKRRPKGFCSDEYAIKKIANMNLKVGDVIGTCMGINETVSEIHKEYYKGFTFGYRIITKENIACGGIDGLNYEACVVNKKTLEDIAIVIERYIINPDFPEKLKDAIKNNLFFTEFGTIKDEYVADMNSFCNGFLIEG